MTDEPRTAGDVPLPGGEFRLFVTRLAYQLMMSCGLLENPVTGSKDVHSDNARMLLADLRGARACVESGSLLSWNDQIKALFDAVILLWIPPKVRLERLRARELRRLGRVDDEFMEWAATYDQPGNRKTRSRLLHEEWLEALACPVLKLEGDLSPEERLARSLSWLRSRPGSDSRRKP